MRALLADDAVDLLLISPERLNNPRFRDDDAAAVRRARRAARGRRGALHLRLGARLPARLPAPRATCSRALPDGRRRCSARRRRRTTASSPTSSEQLGGGALKTYRGPLGRASLRLEVVELPGQAERLAWLATWLPQLPGSGIVYTLTKRDAERVAEWLNDARDPGRGLQRRDRDRAAGRASRTRLLRNELKAVVATSALGMGYDKPDLGFVVHYQAPGSVIAYYQQVGRAGPRDRARRGRAAARRRGPPDPGLLHRAGVPARASWSSACWRGSTRPATTGRRCPS